MPIFIDGKQATEAFAYDGDTIGADGERYRLSGVLAPEYLKTATTLEELNADTSLNDEGKKKQIQDLIKNKIISGGTVFKNYSDAGRSSKKALEYAISKSNIYLTTNQNPTNDGRDVYKRKLATAEIETANGRVPLNSVMSSMGLNYETDWNKGVTTLRKGEFSNTLANGVKSDEEYQKQYNSIVNSSSKQADFQYAVSGSQADYNVYQYMAGIKERDRLFNLSSKYIDEVANRLRKGDYRGGEAIIAKMMPNLAQYGLTEEEVKSDPIRAIATGLVKMQAAYSATFTSDTYNNDTGSGDTKMSSSLMRNGLNTLVNGTDEQLAQFIDSSVTYTGKENNGMIFTHNRRTSLDETASGMQLNNKTATKGTFGWMATKFADGIFNSSIIANTINFFGGDSTGMLKNRELNSTIARDVLGEDDSKWYMLGSEVAGNVAGMLAEGMLLRKATGWSMKNASSIQAMNRTSKFVQYGLYGGYVPVMQDLNEAQENPLWEQYLDNGWKQADFTKALADGIQNMGTMWIGNQILEPALKSMVSKKIFGDLTGIMKAKIQLPTPPITNGKVNDTVVKYIINSAGNVAMMNTAVGLGDLIGGLGLDYASIKLSDAAAGYADTEESIFGRSTKESLGSMFDSPDMLARVVGQRLGGKFVRNVSAMVQEKFVKEDDDIKRAGTVAWYKEKMGKYSEGKDVRQDLTIFEKLGIGISNKLFGNSLATLDIASRVKDGGFFDEAMALEGRVNGVSAQVTKLQSELGKGNDKEINDQIATIKQNALKDIDSYAMMSSLKWLAHEGALNIISKATYGMDSPEFNNHFLSNKWSYKNSNGQEEVLTIKNLHDQFLYSVENDTGGAIEKFSSMLSTIKLANSGGLFDQSSIDIFGKDADNATQLNVIKELTGDKLSAKEFKTAFALIAHNVGGSKHRGNFGTIIQKIESYLGQNRNSANPLTKQNAEAKLAVLKNINDQTDTEHGKPEILSQILNKLGLKANAKISDDKVAFVKKNLTSLFSPEQTEKMWEIGLGYGMHSEEFKLLLRTFRGSVVESLRDGKKSPEEMISDVIGIFEGNKKQFLKFSFESLKGKLNSLVGKKELTESEKIQAKTIYGSMKIITSLSIADAMFINDMSKLLKDPKIMNVLLSSFNVSLTDAEDAETKAMHMSQIAADQISEMTMGAWFRKLMNVDLSLYKFDARQDILRRTGTDAAKKSRALNSIGIPERDEYSTIIVNEKNHNGAFPNLTSIVNLKLSNDPDDVKNVFVALAIKKFEQSNYGKGKAWESDDPKITLSIAGEDVFVTRQLLDGKNVYTIKYDDKKIDNQIIGAEGYIQTRLTNEFLASIARKSNQFVDLRIQDLKIVNNSFDNKDIEGWVDEVSKFYSTSNPIEMIRMMFATGEDVDTIYKYLDGYINNAIGNKVVDAGNRKDVATQMIKSAHAYVSYRFSYKFDKSGTIVKVGMTPSTINNVFTNANNKDTETQAFVYAVDIELPKGLTSEEEVDLTDKILMKNNLVSSGLFGNNSKNIVYQFNHDIKSTDGFNMYFPDKFEDSLIGRTFKEMSPGRTDEALLKSSYNTAIDSIKDAKGSDRIKNFTAKFVDEYGKQLEKDYRDKYVSASDPESNNKLETEIKDERKDKKLNIAESKIEAIRETINDYSISVDSKLKSLSTIINLPPSTGTSADPRLVKERETIVTNIANFIKDLGPIIDGIRNSLKTTPKTIEALDATKSNVDTLIQHVNTTVESKLTQIKSMDMKFIPEFSDLGRLLEELKNIDSSSMAFAITKILNTDVDFNFKNVEDTKLTIVADAIRMIRTNVKRANDADTDKAMSLMLRFVSQGNAALTTDYPNKRSSYANTPLISKSDFITQAIGNRIRPGKAAKKSLVVVGTPTADGNSVYPTWLVQLVGMLGDASGGKINIGTSKNQTYNNPLVMLDQIDSLVRSLGIVTDGKVTGLTNIGIADGSTVVGAVSSIKQQMKSGELDLMVLPTTSFKGMPLAVVDAMKGNNVLFAGQSSGLWNNNNNLSDVLTDVAAHAYLKTNADEKEIAEQAMGSKFGRALVRSMTDDLTDKDFESMSFNQADYATSAGFGEAMYKVIKKIGTGSSVKGISSKAIGFNLVKGEDIVFADKDDSLMMPSVSIGSIDFGKLILDVKGDSNIDINGKKYKKSILADGLINGKKSIIDVVSKDMVNANSAIMKFLEDNKIVTNLKNNGKDNWIVMTVRYPVVSGGNFAPTRIKGIKIGAEGSSIQKSIYELVHGGDWDGDMVQLLGMQKSYFKNLYRDIYDEELSDKLSDEEFYKVANNTVYKAYKELIATIKSSKIDAGEGNGSIRDEKTTIGPVLAEIEVTTQYLDMAKRFMKTLGYENKESDDSYELYNIVRNIFLGLKTGVKDTDTGRIAEVVEPQYIPRLNYGNLNDISHMIVTDDKGAIASLGSVAKEELIYRDDLKIANHRVYTKDGKVLVFKDSEDIAGAREIVYAKSYTELSASKIEDEIINNGSKFEDGTKWLQGKHVATIGSVTSYWDKMSTSRVKLESILQNLKMDGNEDFITGLFRFQFASLAKINFTKDGYSIAGLSGNDKSVIDSAKAIVGQVYSHYTDKAGLSIKDFKKIRRMTNRQLPEGKQFSEMLAILDKITTDDFVANSLDLLSPSMKSLVQTSKWLKNNMITSGPMAKQIAIAETLLESPVKLDSFSDYYDQDGKPSEQIKLLQLAQLFTNMFDRNGGKDENGKKLVLNNIRSAINNSLALIDLHTATDFYNSVLDKSRILATPLLSNINEEDIKNFLTSKELSLKSKDNNIELSDSVAKREYKTDLRTMTGEGVFSLALVGKDGNIVKIESLLKSLMSDIVEGNKEGATGSNIKDAAIAKSILGSLSQPSQVVMMTLASGVNKNMLEKLLSNDKIKINKNILDGFVDNTRLLDDRVMNPVARAYNGIATEVC